jgi:hypothetical protein
MKHNHANVVRCIEEMVAPFYAEVTLTNKLMFGLLEVEASRWLVVHRARPHDNPRVDRRAVRVQLFRSRGTASPEADLSDPTIRVLDAGRGTGTRRFELVQGAKVVSLSAPNHVVDWLVTVLSASFATGTGDAFDDGGNVRLPAWMTARNLYLTGATSSSSSSSSSAAPASRAPSIPGGIPGGVVVDPPRASAPTGGVVVPTVVSPPRATTGLAMFDPGAPPEAGPPEPAVTEGVTLVEYDAADEEGAPSEYFCPITMELMRDPVIASDGHSYERSALQEWLRTHKHSPKTGAPLADGRVVPNHMLRGLISSHVEQARARRSLDSAASRDAPPPPEMAEVVDMPAL